MWTKITDLDIGQAFLFQGKFYIITDTNENVIRSLEYNEFGTFIKERVFQTAHLMPKVYRVWTNVTFSL